MKGSKQPNKKTADGSLSGSFPVFNLFQQPVVITGYKSSLAIGRPVFSSCKGNTFEKEVFAC